jgi:hypothetical protein
MEFMELSVEERIAQTLEAREAGVPLARWVALSVDDSKAWESRAKLAAQLLRDAESVADLGCGHMLLEPHLKARYIPVDLVMRDARTIVVDFNKALPEIPATHFAALGLLEYIYDLPAFLSTLQARFRGGVLSFAVRKDEESSRERLGFGWVNDESQKQLEELLVRCGFSIRESRQWQGMPQWLYRVDAK